MFKSQTLLTGGGSALAAAVVDYSVGWQVLPNPIYFVPIAIYAWSNDRRTGLWIALCASLAFAAVQLLTVRAHPYGLSFATLGIQFAGSVGIAFAANGIRRLVQTCRRSAESVPLEDRVAHARAVLRRIDQDGQPRERGNLDQH